MSSVYIRLLQYILNMVHEGIVEGIRLNYLLIKILGAHSNCFERSVQTF